MQAARRSRRSKGHYVDSVEIAREITSQPGMLMEEYLTGESTPKEIVESVIIRGGRDAMQSFSSDLRAKLLKARNQEEITALLKEAGVDEPLAEQL